MKILYIAYSCNPYAGSEDKIGWNVPYAAAKAGHQVWIITKEEQREPVERFLEQEHVENLRVDYVDIPSIYKELYKGPLYSGRLNTWHRRAFPLAEKLCRENNIEVIHQIAPIEFRAIGPYKKIRGIKFICGPLGGGESIPKGLKCYAKGHMTVEYIRAVMNNFSRFALRLNGRLRNSDGVLYANNETKEYLKKVAGKNASAPVMTEIGVNESDLKAQVKKVPRNSITFLCAGRLIYRKGIDLLFDAMELFSDHSNYTIKIVGGGQEYEHLSARCRQSSKLKKHVVMTGKITFPEMQKQYADADVFVMPSIRETTGTVILEAMSFGLPVVTIGRFGGAVILNEEIGWLYDGKSKEEFVSSLARALQECISDPDEVIRRGTNARLSAERYLWQNKVQRYLQFYRSV